MVIAKHLEPPVLIAKLRALERRLSAHHEKKEIVTNQIQKLLAGYEGEKSLVYFLSFLDDEYFYILHDLRLRDGTGYFQIDLLILTLNFGLIVEVKNIYGTITFDQMGQAIRTTDEGKDDGFANPILQVSLQKRRLRNWLRMNKIPIFPIENTVVYSNPRTIVRNLSNQKEVNETVIHKEKLLEKIDHFNAIHKTSALTKEHLISLTKLLIQSHQTDDSNVLSKYQIHQNELLRGVFCPECHSLPMTYDSGRWRCSQCGFISKTAHVQALEDYRLLIGNTIKNREAREFLQIGSSHAVKRLLKKSTTGYSGITSNRNYFLS